MPGEGQGVHHLHGAPLHPVRPLAAGDVEQPRKSGGGSIAHRGPQTGKLGPRVRRRTETDGVKVNQGYQLLKSLNISHCVFGITRIMSMPSSKYSFPERPASAGSRNLNRRGSYLLYPGIMTTAHEDLAISKTKTPSTSFINHYLKRFRCVTRLG